MSIVEKFRKLIVISKLARRYTINNNEIVFNVVKNEILKMLGKQERPIKVIVKKGKQYISFPDSVFIYYFLKVLDAGWTIADNSDKITACYQSKSPCIKIRREIAAECWSISEIFVDKVYGERFHGSVIDVGAYNGDSSIYFALNGAERVIALEPFPENFELAKENVKINNLEDKIVLLPYAFAREEGEIELYASKKNPNLNSFKPINEITKGIEFDVIKVKTISLQKIVNDFKISSISLLKLDCEGCEYDTLPYLSDELYDKIESIVLEYHNGPKNLPEILKSKGFSVKYDRNAKVGIMYAIKNK
ncbi:MAG: FkbM family methyltransferase [Candidatus Rehaiarchaeum fermentans]|nr:FkbM family methyltransferase [Candidatus Rehaiarchaeum fermentans]